MSKTPGQRLAEATLLQARHDSLATINDRISRLTEGLD